MNPHLTHVRDFERHCRDPRKRAGYERLLTDFGIHVERFTRLVRHPRLVFAEQPGCWLDVDYLMRARLLRRLAATLEVDAGSGVLSLASDAFTCRGAKRDFLTFDLHPELGPVSVVGAAYVRRHRNRVYGALSISGPAYERLAALLDTALALLDAAAVSATAFAGESRALLAGGVRAGLRKLLPACERPARLRELGARLRRYDLEAARRPLAAAREALTEGVAWSRYWDRVNGVFLGAEIGRLGPLLNRFLLTVDDPVKMARHLIRTCRPGALEPIAVAGIVAAGDKYRMVFFDPDVERFFYCPRPGRRRDVPWSRVRELAAEGRTGGPAGTLEYLLMAASGIYLVADPVDGRSPFERDARRVHHAYTGLPFPRLTFPPGFHFRDSSFLRMFEPGFAESSRRAVDGFFSRARGVS